ncbi:GEVED domain-containing protein [Paraoerskovia marina]|uniref:DUF7927 domain-containing protein n=1 Tax=Paraoerskovia marina TaxID=545619 RepID=UPI0012DC7916|nr:GEVED domain-containing protein [Paraoerskovia marina]
MRRTRRSSRTIGRGVAGGVGASLVLTLGLVAAPVVYEPLAQDLLAAEAVPGQPGVMEAPEDVYHENFENVTWQEPDEAGSGSNQNDWDAGDFVQTLTDFPYGADGSEANYQAGYTSSLVQPDGTPLDVTYTADEDWAAGNYCNGIIVAAHGTVSYQATTYDSPRPRFWADPLLNPTDGCEPTGGQTDSAWWNRLRSMARAMGEWHENAKYPYLGVFPAQDADENHIVSSYTNAGAATLAPGTMLEFEQPLTVDPGRFYQFSIDTASQSCNTAGAVGALPQFNVTQSDGSVTQAFSTPVDTCDVARDADNGVVVPPSNVSNQSRQTRIATWIGDTAVRSTGDTLGVQIENLQTSGVGNDTAFDNITILDTTPKIDKEFSAGPYPTGSEAQLTFTITNTYDPTDPTEPSGPKEDWAFVDEFSSTDLELTGNVFENTCGDAAIDENTGQRIAVSGGDLTGENLVSCQITVGVTSDVPGVYTNGPDDFPEDGGLVGLNPPGEADVTFVQNPPECELEATLWQFTPPASETGVTSINLVTGAQTDEGTVPPALNGVGFNPATGWYVGYQVSADGGPQIYTVSPDFSEVVNLGWPWDDGNANGFAEPQGVNTGDLDGDGLWYIREFDNTGSLWAAIDMDPASATYLQVVNGGSTGSGDNANTLGADWAWSPVTEKFYSVGNNSSTLNSFLWEFDPATGSETLVGRPNLDAGGNRLQAPDGTNSVRQNLDTEFGAIYADADGFIYAANNGTGHIWRIDPATTATDGTGEPWVFFAYGPASSGNDGARCPGPLPLDWGDAPESYETLAQDGGAFHGIVPDADDPALMLGSTVTAETDGQPTDLDGDDALPAGLALSIDDGSIELNVPVTNEGGEVAFLAGWIDFDASGTFEDDEGVEIGIDAQTGVYDLPWSVPADAVLGETWLRLRTSYTAGMTSGLGYDYGEVEDWQIELIDADYDFGDAPDTYGTTLAADGARHVVLDFDETTQQAPLRLGDVVDVEEDGQPTTAADGDDTTGTVDDEDSASAQFQAVEGSSSTVDVVAVNDSAEDATLAAWIDLDFSGTFDDGELQSIAVPANTGSQTYQLTFPGASSFGDTYGRIRLFAGTNTDPEPTGEWTGGEIEDYVVPVLQPGVTISKNAVGDPQGAEPGDVVTYEIEIENTGTFDYPAGNPMVVTDDLTDVVDDATVDEASLETDPEGQGLLYYDPNTDVLSWSGPLAAGETVTVRYDVTVNDPATGDGVLTNSVLGPPESNCVAGPDGLPTGDHPECTVTIPFRDVEIAKTSAPSTVVPGDEVEYAVTLTNTGDAPYEDPDSLLEVSDDLSAVLDDASFGTVTTDSDVDGSAPPAATFDEGTATLAWAGPLAVGETVTITYTVTVLDPPEDGDGLLANVVSGPPESNCAEGADPADPACMTSTPVKMVEISKAVTPDGPVEPGDVVAYTITIVNTGQVPYDDTAGLLTVTDDFTDVEDDATYRDDASDGGAGGTFTGPAWTGPVGVGETVTLTYSFVVDNPPAGDGVLDNVVTGPAESNCAEGEEGAECATTTPVKVLYIEKTVDPSAGVTPGDDVAYTITITNTGGYAYTLLDPAMLFDDLTEILDDAEYNDDAAATSDVVVSTPPEPTYQDPTIDWEGPLALGETVTITYSVTVDDPLGPGADGILDNTVIGQDESNCEVDDPDVECNTEVPVASLDVVKTSDAAGPVAPGDEVEYTVAVTNTGAVDYVEGVNPVVVSDDLSAVLDDAEYNDDAAADPDSGTFDVAGTTLTWTGPLAAGASVELTYSVTVDDPPGDGSDGLLQNAVVGPPESSCAPDDDPVDPACVTEVPVRSLEIVKDSSASGSVLAGDTVTYSVEITNTGAVDYTDGEPVVVSDDLAGVLDDAEYNDDAAADPESGTFDLAGTTLTWTGPLAAGDTVTLTYSVTLDDPPGADADGELVNVVVGPPESTCAEDSEDPDCGTSTPVRSLDVVKTASVPDVLRPGDQVTYTVEVSNTGAVDYVDPDLVVLTDDLSDVLAETDLVGAPTATSDVSGITPPAPTVVDDVLTWEGPLAVGETVTITYTVQVMDPLPDDADGVLDNAVVGPPESNCDPGQSPEDPACSERIPQPELEVVKTSDAVGEVVPGDTVEFTVTVLNAGEVDYTAEIPAVVEDDLSGVLDDATYDDDAAANPELGTFTFTDPSLVWTGPLAAGESVTLTYSVTVDDPPGDAADGVLVNAVLVEGSNCGEDSEDPDCTVTVPVRSLDIVKTSDAGTSVAPGDAVTYSVAVTNTGTVPYTAISPVTLSDDLSDLLDDGRLTGTPVATSDVVANVPPQPIYSAPVLTWTGPLDPGETVTVTYVVTVDDPPGDDADGILGNTVVGPPESSCDADQDPADPDCTVTTPVRLLEVVKTAEPTGSVALGETVEYTLVVTNSGQADYTAADPAVVVDDLSGVLDDASWNADAAATSDVSTPPTPVFDPVGETLSWTGPVSAGETVTITYSMTVDDPPGEDADGVLENAVTGTDSSCVTGTSDPDCTTTTPVRSLAVVKTSDAGDVVLAGGTVTYTVTVTNTGGFDYTDADPAVVVDDLADVVDDAVYNGDATANPDSGAFDYAAPTLTWTGPLAAGAQVELTYSVTVDDPSTGDGVVENVVTGPDSNCPEGSTDPDCTTSSPVQQVSVVKTSDAEDVMPGDVVEYTVTIENIGQVDYAADELVVSDDLTEVLDDAEYNDDASADPVSGSFDYEEPVLTWSGPLAAGSSVTLTYSITVDNLVTGDSILANAVVGPPESNCDVDQIPADPDCSTSALTPATEVAKTSDAGDEVVPGDVVEYTVTVTNTGQVDYTDGVPLVVTDDLSGVLDDASYNDDAATGPETGEIVVDEPFLEWSGPLAVGESVVITYSVTVDAPPQDGADGQLTNVVLVPDSNCTAESTDPECTTSVPVRSLEIAKTSDAVGSVVAGDTVEYTVTLTNTGQVDYADGELSVSDDLTGVLDDATYDDDAAADPDTGTFDYVEPTLTWTGGLAAGESVDLTYSVTLTDPVEGDASLTNAVVGPPESTCAEGTDDPGCTVTDTVRRSEVVKSTDAGPQVFPGDTVGYTVTIENTGTAPYTVLDPATAVDDLSRVLDDATYDDNAAATSSIVMRTPPAPTYSRPDLAWTGALAVGETVTITYSVTVADPPSADGDGRLDNTVVGPEGSGCPAGSTDPDCTTSVPVAALDVVKTSDAAGAVVAGDTVTYTVTVSNIGQVDYTDDSPVVVSDDLSGVLDDATYGADAVADPGTGAFDYTEPTLTWTGPLAAGDSVDLTYSVTVDDPPGEDADGLLENAVVGPPESGCEQGSADPDCSVTVPVRELDVVKSSDGADEPLTPGETVTYSVEITNTGQADYTAAEPVVVTDDLSDVLDDATYNLDAEVDPDTGLLAYADPVLTWTGPLAVGESVVITYSVTVDDVGEGDQVLRNTVVGPPESNCDPGVVPEDPACTEIVRQPALTVAKTSDAGGSVAPGDVVEYEVTVENTGAVDYTDEFPAQLVDDLTFVLDDATYNQDAAVRPDQGSVSFVDPELVWVGPLAVGETITLTYSVTVNDPVSGDGSLDNRVTGPDSNCLEGSDDPACTVSTPVRSLDLTKSVEPDGAVTVGDDVTYTVTLTNDGGYDFTADDPAVAVDSLADVLDDATLTGDPGVTPDQGELTFVEPYVVWVGPLDAGESVQIVYTVTVDDRESADGTLENLAFVPPEVPCTDPDGCEGLPPVTPPQECVDGVDPETGGACATTSTPVASLGLVKTSDADGSAAAGDVVTYTVTVTNTGEADYTDANPVVVADDLAGVLDDATYGADATVSPDQGAVAYDAPVLTWTGPLAVGESVDITYSVTVDDSSTGDGVLDNTVVGPPESSCPDGAESPDCTVTVPLRSLEIVKTSDGGADQIEGGQVVTYTVTVTNTGEADYTDASPVVVTDDMSDVLDDATYGDDATVSPDQGAVAYDEPVLTWTGPLAVGESVEITYSVTVDEAADGDQVLRNVVVGPPESNCDPGAFPSDPDCREIVPQHGLTVSKTSDADAAVVPGETVTYTVNVENTGGSDYDEDFPAIVQDDLSGVLDDATYNDDAAVTPDQGSVTVVEPFLEWSGPLAVGESVEITYSVTVDDPPGGDGVLENAVVAPGSACEEGSDDLDCSTSTPVKQLEIVKTSDAAAEVGPGGTVTYTVEMTNTGTYGYTEDDPAVLTDTMTGVLDVATYNDDATVSPEGGEITFADPELVWAGPLAPGETVTLTYSVTVDEPPAGDASLVNAVLGPPESNCPVDMSGFGMSASGLIRAVSVEDCTTTVPVASGALEIEKAAAEYEDAVVGDVVTYTVVATNVGSVDFTAGAPATVVDDMTEVLDDATYNDDATVSPEGGDLVFDAPQLIWSGPLAAGDSVEITYSVTLTGEGDLEVRNVAFAVPGPDCTAGAGCGEITPPAECTDGVDEDGRACDDVEFTITPSVPTAPPTSPTNPALPVTGAQVAAMVGLVLLLLIGGAALLGSGRLRRRHDGHDDGGGVGSL